MADSPNVYIVDDHEAVRDSLSALLMSNGLSVEVFASGQDFLATFDTSLRGCLLLDIQLPDINGIDLLGKLFRMGSKLRTVMISGYADIPLAVKAMKAGAVDFIEKPYRDEVILDSVRYNLAEIERETEKSLLPDNTTLRLEQLSPREREVMEALVSGQPNKVIAHQLGIRTRTVEAHRARVMAKMEARSLSHLVRMALMAGIDTASF